MFALTRTLRFWTTVWFCLLICSAAWADVRPKQVQIEAKVTEVRNRFELDLGVAWPLGEFGDFANPGLDVGFDLGTPISQRLDGEFEAATTFYGTEDIPGWDDLKIMGARAMFNLNLLLNQAERGEVLSNPRVIISGGGGVATIKWSGDDWSEWETGPAVSGGAEVDFFVGETVRLAGEGKYYHVFTEEGHDFATANLELKVTPHITPDDWVMMGLSVVPVLGAGLPMGDFGQVANPGMRAGVKGRFGLTGNLDGIAGIIYQTFGIPYEPEGYDISQTALDFEVGGLLELPKTENSWLTPYLTTSIIVTNMKNKVESGGETIEVKDTGTLVLGGLMVEKKVSNRVRLGIMSQIPLLGFMFEDDTPRRANTELLIFITPKILNGGNDGP